MITVWFKEPIKFTQQQIQQEGMFAECNKFFLCEDNPKKCCLYVNDKDFFFVELTSIDIKKSNLNICSK